MSSIEPWAPKPSDQLLLDAAPYVCRQNVPTPETTYEITITLEGYGEAALGRVLGCVMLGIMPDRGLQEALYSLREMLEFYSQEPSRFFGRALPPKRIDATVVSRKTRPDLIISP